MQRAGRKWMSVGLAGLASCASHRADVVLRVPRVIEWTELFRGSTLSGARVSAEAIESDPGRAWVAHLELLYLAEVPRIELDPLANHARLVVQSSSGEPFRSASALANGLRVGFGSRASDFLVATRRLGSERCAQVLERDQSLPPGTSLRWHAGLHEAASAGREVELVVAHLGEGRAEVAIALDGGDDASSPQTAARLSGEDLRETLLLDVDLAANPSGVMLLIPTEFLGATGGAFALSLSLVQAADDETSRRSHAESVDRTLSALASSGAGALARARELTSDEAFQHEVVSALDALRDEVSGRAALVFLCSSTEAQLGADLALVVRAGELALFTGQLEAALPDSTSAAHDPRALGWTLESNTYRWLAKLVSESKIPPELDALLLRHAGQVGRFAGTIEDLVKDAKGIDDLRARLVSENRIFLEDNDPGARVRAFDWLKSRGLQPAGFDPLATREARQRALDALEGTPR